ncbi:hypothetical protein [Paraflavitalea pollutisoli]|uniref:hypothetical protein n=1 Tax=Paraflavitalea pollutisoli TaxID=3034143 RepID=UPI0023EBEEB3|nr:hypothetical protein [Paraflavitalea sp. H1-2-19X]
MIVIPVTMPQKQLFDSLSIAYQQQTPYDYALFGMRCGSAAYEILARLDLLKRYPPKKTALKIFYPKKLRKRLLKQASSQDWTVIRQEGTPKRRWERD